jgi:hypothetical protein
VILPPSSTVGYSERPTSGEHLTGLVRVGAFADHGEAHAARGYLEGHGIRAEVTGDDANQTGPPTSFAQVALLVPQGQADETRRLLAELADDEEPSAARTSRTEVIVAVGLTVFILGFVVIAFAVS